MDCAATNQHGNSNTGYRAQNRIGLGCRHHFIRASSAVASAHSKFPVLPIITIVTPVGGSNAENGNVKSPSETVRVAENAFRNVDRRDLTVDRTDDIGAAFQDNVLDRVCIREARRRTYV